jgi:hypothetical protein
MLLDLAIVAAILAFGNWKFRRFDPFLPVWKRVLKTAMALAVTAVISWYFGTRGVMAMLGVIMIPLLYVHGYWLPKNGVNGWTAEPKEKYYALRGWKRGSGADEKRS